MKSNPSDPQIREAFWKERKACKTKIRAKKRCTIKEFKSKNNPRKKIRQATNQETHEDIPIPVEELGSYFKSLLSSPTATQHANPLRNRCSARRPY